MFTLRLLLIFACLLPALNLPAHEPATAAARKEKFKVNAINPLNPAVQYRKAYRYKGKIGMAEITMWLEADSVVGKPGKYDALSCNGFYFYDRYRKMLTLQAAKFDPKKPLELEEEVIDREKDTFKATGKFRATGPPGKTLTGTWTSADGKRKLPFTLQEDYSGAVKYLVVRRDISGPACKDGGAQSGYQALFRLEYLLLDLPGKPAVEKLLRKEFGGPKPEIQMPAYLKNLMRTEQYHCQEVSHYLSVKYNGDHILSAENHRSFHGYGAPSFHHSSIGTNLDLRTGRKLQLQDLLKPAFWKDGAMPDYGSDTEIVVRSYPGTTKEDFTISADGLIFYQKQGNNVLEVFVSYASIQHLIRPDGPLKVFLFRR